MNEFVGLLFEQLTQEIITSEYDSELVMEMLGDHIEKYLNGVES